MTILLLPNKSVRNTLKFTGPDIPHIQSYLLVRLAAIFSIWFMVSFADADQNPIVLKPQSVTEALTEFAKKTGLQLVYPSELTEGLNTTGAKGNTPEAVLEQLLEGTGLTYEYLNPSTVTLIKKNNDAGVIGVHNKNIEKRKSPLDEENKRRPASFFSRMVAALAAGLIGGGTSTGTHAAGDAGDRVIEEIVVTATKRSQSILDVAASISALSSEELGQRGIKNMYDLQFAVPSMHFGEMLGEQNITIRGVSGFNRQPGVSLSVDGIYQSRMNTARLNQLDLERIEVLRGPQGTLYGRNSNGGVVNIVTAGPTEEVEGYVRVGYAEFQEASFQAVYSGPIGDNVAFRIAVDHTDRGEGWINNLVPGEDDLLQGDMTNVRGKLSVALSDSVTADLVIARSEMDGPMDHFSWLTLDRDLAAFMADGVVSFEPHESYAHPFNESEREYALYGLTLTWDLPFGYLKSISATQKFDDYFDMDRANYSIPVFRTPQSEETETFTQEFNLVGETGNLDWVLGVFYMEDEWKNDNQFAFLEPQFGFPAPPIIDFQVTKYETVSAAVFFDASWNVTDRTRINFGARHTQDEIDEQHTNAFFIAVPDPVLLFKTCDQTVEEDWSETTLKAGVQHDLNENTQVYFTYAEGYKAGGFATNECGPAYDPETIDSIELGYKASLFNAKAQLAAAAFYYDYTDFQVVQVVELASITRNAGDAEVWGFELELDASISESWSWNLGLTLLDATYQDFVNFDPKYPELGFQQLKGNRLNSSPETSLNLGLHYANAAPWGGSIAVRADLAYRSRTYYREFNEREDSQGAYTVINLNALWRSSDEYWEARLYVNNATDEEYLTFILGTGADGGRHGTWAMPRQAGFEVTRRF